VCGSPKKTINKKREKNVDFFFLFFGQKRSHDKTSFTREKPKKKENGKNKKPTLLFSLCSKYVFFFFKREIFEFLCTT